MGIEAYLDSWGEPATGWPDWLGTVPYVGSAHPLADAPGPIEAGANCQRYAYAVLALYEIMVPGVRSSELWTHARIRQVSDQDLQPLDLVLFNESPSAFGAHVGVQMAADQVLHLCAEVGRPAMWSHSEFAERARYGRFVGGVRVLDGSRGG